MKRLISCCLAVALCFAMASPSAAAHSKLKVYMLSGIFNISAGLRELAAKLTQRGIAATVYLSEEPDIVTEAITSDYRNNKVRRIVLIGYSAGAAAAVSIAERLNQDGMPVALLVTLDPVVDLTMPPNVKRAVNFHLGSALLHGAGASNVTVDDPDVNHLSLQHLESIHQKIIGYIK